MDKGRRFLNPLLWTEGKSELHLELIQTINLVICETFLEYFLWQLGRAHAILERSGNLKEDLVQLSDFTDKNGGAEKRTEVTLRVGGRARVPSSSVLPCSTQTRSP